MLGLVVGAVFCGMLLGTLFRVYAVGFVSAIILLCQVARCLSGEVGFGGAAAQTGVALFSLQTAYLLGAAATFWLTEPDGFEPPADMNTIRRKGGVTPTAVNAEHDRLSDADMRETMIQCRPNECAARID